MAEEFINQFIDYQTCDKRLGFLSPRYKIEASLDESTFGGPGFMNGDLKFNVSTPEGRHFGHITLTRWDIRPNDLQIDALHTGYDYTPQHRSKVGYGRELVRRTMLFAKDAGAKKVETSAFVNDATSFWLGLGFAPAGKIKPNWDAVPPSAEVDNWQKKLADKPESIWQLANTEIGKRVLKGVSASGVFSFDNEAQRAHMEARLKLPAKALG